MRVVGIGASAGGLHALELFFSELSGNLGAVFVVIQHLSPDYDSALAEILQRATPMSVVALEQETEMVPDHVYVNSPNLDVRIDGHWIRLVPRTDHVKPLHLPIDDFFFSLAAEFGSDSVGIVLSGMGTDGSRGLREIKGCGGLAMIQAPPSAEFDGMPRSALRQDVADLILPPESLARKLGTILRNGELVTEEEDLDDMDRDQLIAKLLNQIKIVTHLDFTPYRQSTIDRRIEKRMLLRQESSLREYIGNVLKDDAEMRLLQQSFLIGVTRFFRDQAAFEVLREKVIPRICQQHTGKDPIRIWVPSCSTGEEVYSIGMLLADYLEQEGDNREFKIFGTDVDQRSIVIANQGEYDTSILADVSHKHINKYFFTSSAGFRVRPELRRNIFFAVQNLLADSPFVRIDLISCRNFLIYIDKPSQQNVLANFHFGLNPGGTLFLGPSESLSGLESAFDLIDRRWKIFQKRENSPQLASLPALSTKISDTLKPRTTETHSFSITKQNTSYLESSSVKTSSAKIYSAPGSPTSMDYFSRYLSERFAPPTLFVNQNYDVLYLNGDFEGILHLPRFNAHLSLKTIVNEEVQSLLMAGVDRVYDKKNSGVFERINLGGSTKEPRWVSVRFSIHEFTEANDTLAILQFDPIDEQLDEGGEIEIYAPDQRLRAKIKELERELQRSETRARKLHNELETTNEELQSSNRELLASNEELQSTNEELQSVNEELYTVNSEFQRKNEELNTTYNDLENLLLSTQISTIFVDRDLGIRRFSPGIRQQFDLNESDTGRPITSFSSAFEDLNIGALCREVLDVKSKHEEEITDRKGNAYLLRVLPYQSDEEEIDGVVITFIDINELVKARQKLKEMANKYRAIFQNTEEGVLVIRESGKIEEANQKIVGSSVEMLVGEYFSELIAQDEQKVVFNNLLRSAFDEKQAASIKIVLSGPKNKLLHTRMEIIPTYSEEQPLEQQEYDRAVLLLHDESEWERERQEREDLLNSYQKSLATVESRGGVLALDGEILALNFSNSLELSSEDYLTRNVRDFLTESGVSKINYAFEKIMAGSLLEEVSYLSKDLLHQPGPLLIQYRPVRSSQGIAFITVSIIDQSNMVS